jgi:uncharacterized membrane protein YphA (DoxX/SURF4 family)
VSQILLPLQVALAVGLGGVFVASALPKLRHPRGFVLAVMEYRVLPMRASWVVGRVAPAVELMMGLMLATGVLLPVAASAAMALLLCFLAAIGLNLARGRDLDCHCFGAARKRKIGWRVMLEDTALLLAGGSLLGLLMAMSTTLVALAAWSPWRLLSLAVSPVESAVIAVGLLAALVVITALLLDPRSAVRRKHDGKAPAGAQRLRASGG